MQPISSTRLRPQVAHERLDEAVVALGEHGHLLDEHQYPAGFVAKMDCGMQGAGAYTGFGHRLPGVWAPVGAVQDWRYYREALTAEDIEKLAMQSRDANGGLLRTCALPEES